MSSASRRSSVRLSLGATGTASKSRRIAHASGAQSRAGRRARRNAVVNHNRRAASDLRTFAIARVALAPPLDFGEFGVANGFELGFVNSNVLN
jgi:hypothetical protein